MRSDFVIKTWKAGEQTEYNLFYKHSVFYWPQYAQGFSNLSLILYLRHAQNNRIYCYGHEVITISEGSTRIHHSANSETEVLLAILSCVKISPSNQMELFNMIRCNMRLLTFAKPVEFLKSSIAIKAGSNVFFLFSSLKMCFSPPVISDFN